MVKLMKVVGKYGAFRVNKSDCKGCCLESHSRECSRLGRKLGKDYCDYNWLPLAGFDPVEVARMLILGEEGGD